jgi:hypothetical protein
MKDSPFDDCLHSHSLTSPLTKITVLSFHLWIQGLLSLLLHAIMLIFCQCREAVSDEVLTSNIQVVAEALAKHIFNLSSEEGHEIFSEGLVWDIVMYTSLCMNNFWLSES